MKDLKTIVKPLGHDFVSVSDFLLRPPHWQEFEGIRYIPRENMSNEYLIDLKPYDNWTKHNESSDLEQFFTIHCPEDYNCLLYSDEETHPLDGISYPEFAKAMSIGFKHQPSFIFGQYWPGSFTKTYVAKVNEKDYKNIDLQVKHHHFRILPIDRATHMIMTIDWEKEEDLSTDDYVHNTLKAWSEFSYLLPESRKERYILPLGFHLPCPVSRRERWYHGDLIKDRFKKHAQQYSERLRQLTTRPLMKELPKNPLTLCQETVELIEKPNKSDNEVAWLRIYMEACIENLAARLRDAGCDKEHMVWFDPANPFVVQIGAKSQHCPQYKGILDVIEYVNQFEQAQRTQGQFQAQFERLRPQLESVNGSFSFGTYVTVLLPRNKFSADQKPYRTTNYSYSEAGLSKFLNDLKKELDEAAVHHAANVELIKQLTGSN